MFDKLAFQVKYHQKLAPGGQLEMCRFGTSQVVSLVAISNSLDRLIVFVDILQATTNSSDSVDFPEDSIVYIAINNVIKIVSTVRSAATTNRSRDLLLICYADSMLVYDTYKQTNLCQVNVSSPISALACTPSGLSMSETFICAGARKLYALRLAELELAADLENDEANELWPNSILQESQFNVEILNEKTVASETINCLIHGQLADDFYLIITGSQEQRISIYTFDTFDQNIQAAKLKIQETSAVVCLCPIHTLKRKSPTQSSADVDDETPPTSSSLAPTGAPPIPLLPSIGSSTSGLGSTRKQCSNTEQLAMDYFACALENGFVCVYRLLASTSSAQSAHDSDAKNIEGVGLRCERLWRHKSKHKPKRLLMYDTNGDGLDELVIAYNNGRVESRLPFTGELVEATRCCFRISQVGDDSRQLVGITTIRLTSLDPVAAAVHSLESNDDETLQREQPMLVTCSESGFMLGFWPKLNRSPRDLKGFDTCEPTSYGTAEYDGRVQSAASRHVEKIVLDVDELALADTLKQDDSKQRLPMTLSSLLAERDQWQRGNRSLESSGQLTRQLAAAYSPPEQVDVIKEICYRWNLEAECRELKLTLFIVVGTSSCFGVEMVEFYDESDNFLCHKHELILVDEAAVEPNEIERTADNVIYSVSKLVRPKQHRASQLSVRIYVDLKSSARYIESTTSCRIHETQIKVPDFCSLVPVELLKSKTADCSFDRISLELADEKYPQLISWLQECCLFARFGRLERTDSSQQSTESPPSVGLDKQPSECPSQRLINSIDKIGQSFELNLVDLVCQSDEVEIKLNTNESLAAGDLHPRLNIKYCGQSKRIQIECTKSSDLLAEVARSLLLGHLDIQLTADNQNQASDLSGLISDVNNLDDQIKQLDECERRTQAEVYESADYVANLMQQFALSIDLDEFSTSKQLLDEISMMLSQAQNAAQAHQLNYHHKLSLSRRSARLKGDITLLSGGATLI